MMASIFLAKVFGLYLAIISVVLLFHYERCQRAINAFFADPALIFITSIITLIMGILLVVSHNLWVMDWRVIVTLLCWSVFIKGLLWFLTPDTMIKFSEQWSDKRIYMVTAILCMAISLCLLYHGFFLQG